MRKFLFILFLLLSYSLSYSQDSITKTQDNSKPFVLDEVPIYPGCKRKRTEDKRKKCMSDKVSKFISKNYDLNLVKTLNLDSGEYTVFIIFKLDKNGDIIETKARGPHPKLEAEGIRVIKLLPKIIPGKIDGKPVTIPYSIPVYLTSY